MQEDEFVLRQEAVRRFLAGEKPVAIVGDMGRSREWLYKWLGRYRSGRSDWYVDRCRAPTNNGRTTDSETERLIVQVRARLEATQYAQVGPNAINWELSKLGHDPLPTSTISDILKRQGLVKRRPRYVKKNKSYPALPVLFPNSIHQADLVGPRFIAGDGRFYSLNVMDLCSHWLTVNPVRTKSDKNVARGLVRTWKTLGIPDFLQLDNELSFRGSNRHPHSLGLVLRLCLAHGIQPIFIPQGEPWRNGTVERFQDTFDGAFFRKQHFRSFTALCEEAANFERFHNANYVYSATGNRTPQRVLEETWHHDVKLPDDFELPKEKIPIASGYIHFVRFIRSDRKLKIFSEDFEVSEELVYEYVWATICTDENVLVVRHDRKQLHRFGYWLPQD